MINDSMRLNFLEKMAGNPDKDWEIRLATVGSKLTVREAIDAAIEASVFI